MTDYSEANLGCGERISSGLDWVFESVAEAIVLEDDCLPDPSFFRFCEELLDRYRGEERIMHISGDNFQSVGRTGGTVGCLLQLAGRRRSPSYYFSRYAHVWGWASWRRAWNHYDFEMSRLAGRRRLRPRQFDDPAEREFWRRTWDEVARGEIDTWDYQWAFACLRRGALSAMPRGNLVSNIGFGEGAHHSSGAGNPLAELPTPGIRFPLSIRNRSSGTRRPTSTPPGCSFARRLWAPRQGRTTSSRAACRARADAGPARRRSAGPRRSSD